MTSLWTLDVPIGVISRRVSTTYTHKHPPPHPPPHTPHTHTHTHTHTNKQTPPPTHTHTHTHTQTHKRPSVMVYALITFSISQDDKVYGKLTK